MYFAVFACVLTVILCVFVHLTTLRLLNDSVLPRFERHSRTAVGAMVLVALVGHLVEIWIFAIAILVVGSLSDRQFAEELELDGFDAFYYSAVSYTSMGAEPLQEASLRLLTAIEALTGLILITWTASFVFIVMQRTWERRQQHR
ncbi:MAG: two pore domain potassium channel family protein [Deltaproteobacteria bacterium]|nr:two pore domain potassium channel family protein [Deltaproteobacteria bacterium]